MAQFHVGKSGNAVMRGTMAEALAPLRARLPKFVREREILRIAATIAQTDRHAAMAAARREALAWAKRRAGGQLPESAWNGQSFEYWAGGRTTLGVRIESHANDLWALRADDPDKSVPGRSWTTEVTIGHAGHGAVKLGLRLTVSSPEEELEIDPHVPGLVRQIATMCGLEAGAFPVNQEPWTVNSEAEVEQLIEMLESPGRALPMFIASGDERTEQPNTALIDAFSLARATTGLAHVAILPAQHTYGLSDAFGKIRSVYHGAVRAYMPRFDAAANPYDHQLFLGETLRNDAQRCVRALRSLAAMESLRRTRLRTH
jgi:hypothetical protein